jgi:6-phosphogluconate dehydrogenase (decarboxylating)
MMREHIVASGQSRQPVTVVGMSAPAPVLAKLADLFGSNVNADTQKKVIDAVRQGMGTEKAASATAPRRVEVVGWLPSEGVMAVAVYPES